MTPEEQLCAAALDGGPPPDPTAGGRRHLSAARILGIVVVAALVAAFLLDTSESTTGATTLSQHGFAPYVDVTATPQYAFEDPGTGRPTDAVLGFVVSSKTDACQPSWGGAYSLDTAADDLDLDRRVARLRQLGGQVTVSFGGAANSELAIGCTDTTDLTAAYRSVVDRYSLDSIDLDIEGADSSDPTVTARRGAAIAALVAAERAAGHRLDVWLTLPVATTGLTAEGLGVLTSMLAAGVRPAGVNAMVMDYGEPMPDHRTMADQAILALTALEGQVRSAEAHAGVSLSDAETWQRIGATPMIGQNDVAGEVFGLADAQRLLSFARHQHLRQLSMWSANRDQGCGPNYPDVRVVSDQCSGVTQDPGAFTAVFGKFAHTVAPAEETPTTSPTVASRADPETAPAAGRDDPATSPYQIWNTKQGYTENTKVVWHHNVYVAKWYSMGDRPDLPVSAAYLTPWSLVGPVLPGDHPAPLPTLPAGSYPDWKPGAIYRGGDRVLVAGVGYQAKWWTQGDRPDAHVATPYDSPWQLITK